MRRIILWSQAHPVWVIAILLAGSVAAFLNIGKIRIDNSIENMMIDGDPAKIVYQETIEKFGSDDITVVFVKDPDLFTPDKLAVLRDLAYDLEDIEGIEKVESLFSVSNIRNEDGFLNTSNLMDWVPETIEEATLVQTYARENDILSQALIAPDGKATAINLYIEPRLDEYEWILGMADKVEEVLNKHREHFDTLFQIGNPYNLNYQDRVIKSDVSRIFPLSALVLIILLIATMRSPSAAVLPLLTAGLSIFYTMGFIGFIGLPFTVLTIIVPSLLLVIGATEDTHILSEYLHGIKEGKTRDDSIDYMSNKVGTAIMLTAITTFFGFLSITINNISVLRQFAITASFGLFVNPIVTAMLAPVYLKYFGPRKARGKKTTGMVDSLLDRLTVLILNLTQDHNRTVLAVCLGLAIVAAGFGLQVEVDSNTIGFYKEGSTIRQRIETLHQDLAGSVTFYLRVTGMSGDFLKPENLALVDDLQKQIDSYDWSDKTISFPNYIKLLHREMNEGNPDFYHVPEEEGSIDEYLLFLRPEDIERYVTPEFDDLVILVRHNVYSSSQLASILEDLEDAAAQVLPPRFQVQLTGQNVLLQNSADVLARGQVMGIFLITLVIFLIMSLLFMNVTAGFYSLIPNLFPVALLFGVMTLFKVPINTGTCMVAVIAIGIAVDDTVHIMTRYHKEMRQLQDQKKSLAVCINAELLPVLSTSISLGLGFAAFAFSSYVPIIQFGVLAAVVMIFALVGDFFLVPTLLARTQLITLWDVVGLHLKKLVTTGSPLFEGMKPREIKKIVLLGKMEDIPAGHLGVTQGDHGKTMFLILEGKATVFVTDEKRGRETVLTQLKPGDIFGEVALVNPGPRSANIRAKTDVKCIEIDWDGLDRMRRFYPRLSVNLMTNLSKILGNRLASAADIISTAEVDREPL
ncbi:MMPL family transporter [candidate division KSB1 bacterium]